MAIDIADRCLNEIPRYNNPFYYLALISQIFSFALRSKSPLINDRQVAVVLNQQPTSLKKEFSVMKINLKRKLTN